MLERIPNRLHKFLTKKPAKIETDLIKERLSECLDLIEKYHSGDLPPEPPSIFTQASGFAGIVAASAIKLARSGTVMVSDDTRKTREEICDTCDKRVGARCHKCGCNLPKKVLLSESTCPEGKW